MANQIISKAVGIDLGTTNSAVAIMNDTDTDILIHKDQVARRETTPSCVWKDPKSGEIVVGNKAFRRVGHMPEPIRSIKRSMGKQAKVLLTDEEVSPEYVSACILGEMKRQIEEDVTAMCTDGVEWCVDRAIITVPAYFDQPQIEATMRAGEMAGLQVLDLLHEPTAAACYHCWISRIQNGVFLVYDFGGGTFDVTVLRCTAGAFEVLGISGNNLLGGDELDEQLAVRLQERLQEDDYALELDVKNDPEDRLRFTQLKFLAEGVKKALSSEGNYYLKDTGTIKDKEGQAVIVETMFDRSELEEILRPTVERTIPYCFDALELAEQRAEIKLSDIDAVILAGGSTHIPLVRDMVRAHLCALGEGEKPAQPIVDERANQPRAKCTEPLYDKVDTIVALGAAIRAAAVGGLVVDNPERTVRISFRGTGVTGAQETVVGGEVTVLEPGVNLEKGRIRLLVPDSNYEDEKDLWDGGSFAFSKVPLQAAAQNLLRFEVYDSSDNLVATAGRVVQQTKEEVRPDGGIGVTSALPKEISLEVTKTGRQVLEALIPAMSTLPANEDFTFTHPGDTEKVRISLYQRTRKIKDITVPVDLSLPRGTPIYLNLNIDELSFITVKGSIGETSFDATVEVPPDREMPSEEEVASLIGRFEEEAAYLPAGQRAKLEARFRKTRQGFEEAAERGETERAVHDFEEMEALVAEVSSVSGPLQPPREAFNQLVAECHEINLYAARVCAESGKPHDKEGMQKATEAQRVQGERAFENGDQRAYSNAVEMLESLREFLVTQARAAMPEPPRRSEEEIAAQHVQVAMHEAENIARLAESENREDFQEETGQIMRELEGLLRDAATKPTEVQQRASQHRARLEQIKNVFMGISKTTPDGIPTPEGKTPEKY